MNPLLPPASPSSRTAARAVPAMVDRPEPASTLDASHLVSSRRLRERDFGVGYGNSSGYASERRYASSPLQPRFRFA